MGEIIKAAIEAGALGAFLSGSGPTILALADENEEVIGKAMEEAGRKSDNPGEVRIVNPSPVGVHEVK
jgi:homoserine kinase